MNTWLNWLLAHWEVLFLLGLYLGRMWRDGRLAEVWEWVYARLLELAKEHGAEIPEEVVKAAAGTIYDAIRLPLPAWADFLQDALKRALLGTREQFQEAVWQKWLELITKQGLLATMLEEYAALKILPA